MKCLYRTLTGNVRGHKHPSEHGALRETQQQKHHRAVGQAHGYTEHTGQTDGEEEAPPTTQPENTNVTIISQEYQINTYVHLV